MGHHLVLTPVEVLWSPLLSPCLLVKQIHVLSVLKKMIETLVYVSYVTRFFFVNIHWHIKHPIVKRRETQLSHDLFSSPGLARPRGSHKLTPMLGIVIVALSTWRTEDLGDSCIHGGICVGFHMYKCIDQHWWWIWNMLWNVHISTDHYLAVWDVSLYSVS